MNRQAVMEIEQAIVRLSPEERIELFKRLDHHEFNFDRVIAADLAAGRLDALIEGALKDEKLGRTRPLQCTDTERAQISG